MTDSETLVDWRSPFPRGWPTLLPVGLASRYGTVGAPFFARAGTMLPVLLGLHRPSVDYRRLGENVGTDGTFTVSSAQAPRQSGDDSPGTDGTFPVPSV
jgi:hypothetical protein